MNIRTKNFLVVIIISFYLLVMVNAVNAKCAMVKYVVKGSVKIFPTGKPIDQARVFIYFDEFELIYVEAYKYKYPDFVMTLSDGTFQATIFFLPEEKFSRLWGEMGCEKNAPKNIEVFILREGLTSRRFKFKEKEFRVYINEKGENIIQLPEITIAGK